MKNIRGVKIVKNEVDRHNVAVLQKRFQHFSPLKKPYERFAAVMLELHEIKYSRADLGASFLHPKYLHPSTLLMYPSGLQSLNTIINKINHDKYKIKYPMLQIYFICFAGQPDSRGISEGKFLVAPMNRKTIPEVVKRLEPVYEGLGLTIDTLNNLYSTKKRTVEKELDRYYAEIESKLIRTKAVAPMIKGKNTNTNTNKRLDQDFS